MGLFMACDGDVAILVKNGIYKQVPIFMRNGYFFAKIGGGFIKLNHDGSTSEATTRIETLSIESIQSLATDPLGRLCDLAIVPGAKPLPEDRTNKLLGIE